MADQTVLQLTETTTAAITDMLYMAFNVATTPVDRKISVASLRDVIIALIGTRFYCPLIDDFTTDVTVRDAAYEFPIPADFNGWNLTYATAHVTTPGTTNATTVMLYNKTDSQNMLSAALSVPSGGIVNTSGTIDTAHDDVATNDIIQCQVKSVSTTAPKGLYLLVGFTKP